MMQQMIRVTTLLSIMMLIFAVPSKADWWDWMAELSGPGGFHSRGNMTLTVYCWHPPVTENAAEGTTGNGRNAHWFHLLQDRNAKGPCVFVDARLFESRLDDTRYFPTRLEIYDSGPTYRLWTPLEIGVGMGVIHFHSGSVKTDRVIFDIPRVSLKPLLLVPSHQRFRNGGLGFLQVYYKAQLIQGELTENNFRPKPGTTFRVNNDVVPAAGFLIDPVALIRLIANK